MGRVILLLDRAVFLIESYSQGFYPTRIDRLLSIESGGQRLIACL